MEIRECIEKSRAFVKEEFGTLRSNDERITILAVMKMQIELANIELEREKINLEKEKHALAVKTHELSMKAYENLQSQYDRSMQVLLTPKTEPQTEPKIEPQI